MTYTPDRWVVLELSSEKYGTIRKVFAGWYGGFTQGDSWKLNSGIVAVTKRDKVFEFEGNTGTVYACHENAHGLSHYMQSVLANFVENITGAGGQIKVLDLAEVASL